MIISEELINKLTVQIGHELENANIYDYLGDWCDVEGLTNLASYFHNQADDELNHAEIIRKHLSDLGAKLQRIQVNTVDFDIPDYKTLGTKFVEREISTTEMIQDELNLAYQDGDGISQKFLLDFIFEQREELNSADAFNRKIQNVSDVYLFDTVFKVEDDDD